MCLSKWENKTDRKIQEIISEINAEIEALEVKNTDTVRKVRRDFSERLKGQKPAVVPPEADDLLRKLTIFGRPDSVKSQFDKWHEHGAAKGAHLLNPGLTIEQYDLVLESFI